jgi:hypothetical protein
MEPLERELLDALVNRVLRHPDEPKDLDAQRAVQRLLAARGDAAYLLLQRALVLEVALARVRAGLAGRDGSGPVAANDPSGLPPGTAGAAAGQPSLAGIADRIATALPARGFLRDAAAVGAGVLAGNLLVAGAASLFDGDAAADGATGAGLGELGDFGDL